MRSVLLDGVRVVDLTTRESWHCARFLASLGAEVVRVDLPLAEPDEDWRIGQADKRCLAIDYLSVDGAELLRQLIAGSDIVVESFAPGRMAELGFGYGALQATQPKLVMVSITPFGQTGPYAHYKGGELVVSAMSGIMSVNGHGDRWPLKEAGDAHYFHAAMAGAFGGLVALYHARHGGPGQHVDISAQELGASRNTIWTMAWQFDKREGARIGPALNTGRGPNHMIWETKDGHAILPFGPPNSPAVVAIAQWMVELGYENPLASVDVSARPDPAFMKRWGEAVGTFLKDRTRSEIVTEGWARKAWILPLNLPRDLVDDPQFGARNFIGPAEGDPHLLLPQWYGLTNAADSDPVRLPEAPQQVTSLPADLAAAKTLETAE